MNGRYSTRAASRAVVIVGALTAVLAVPSASQAQMQTLNFGTPGFLNCSGIGLNQAIPSGDDRFGGFTYSGFRLTQTGNFFGGTGNCVATNGTSNPSTLSSISSDESFVFNGTTIRRSINDANVNIFLTGSLGGNIVFEELVIAASNDFVPFTPMSMQAIDRLQFSVTGGGTLLGPQFQIDNFAFTKVPGDQVVVPEPSTLALLAILPVALLARSRRRGASGKTVI